MTIMCVIRRKMKEIMANGFFTAAIQVILHLMGARQFFIGVLAADILPEIEQSIAQNVEIR